MSCNLFIDETNVTRKLRERVGSNDTLYSAYISTIMDETTGDISSSFIQGLKETKDIDFNNIPNNKLNDVIDYIQEYYNEHVPDINTTTEITDKQNYFAGFGYNSIATRQFGKRISANFMIRRLNTLINGRGTTIEKVLKEESKKRKRNITKKEYFASVATAYVKQEITNRLIKKGVASKESVNLLFKENNTLAIEKLFGENPILQDKNLLAVYKEMLGNRVGYFNEVFRDSRLGDIRFEKDDRFDDPEYDAIDGQLDVDPTEDDPTDGNSVTDDKGTKVDHSTDKFGDYTNFMTHVNGGIKSYLGSLQKLHSGNKTEAGYDLNTDNSLGISDTMSADECSAILYSSADFTNVDTMIASIRTIANTTPGFEAFHKMADDLDVNRDFAFEIYNTFGKFIASKLETVVQGDEAISRISNYASDRLSALKFEYFNTIKATSIRTVDLTSKEVCGNISEIIDSLKDDDTGGTKLELIAEFNRQFRKYYPTLSDYTITNYINKANNGDVEFNAKRLNAILKSTIDSGLKSFEAYKVRQSEIGEIYGKVKEYDELEALMGKLNKEEQKEKDELIEKINKLYSTEYVSDGTRNAAFDLAEELIPYAKVKTELNSRNAQGNQSSDVLNISMITNIMNTLRNSTALENFGKYKTQSRQYDFSNIMIEHKDENGKIINFGLFTQDPKTKELTPTSYAKTLLKERLFNGASNMDSASNVLYSGMSKGDYIGTAFINYFNTDISYDTNDEGIKFANYFMRIPSDAPKNFIIRAPKYSTKGLVKLENGQVVIDTSHAIFKQFKNIFLQELNDAATTLNTFFENKDGYVNLVQDKDLTDPEYGMPQFKEGWDNSAESANKTLKGYHVGKTKSILIKDKATNTFKLTGSVFNSDRFKITKVAQEDITVNGKEYKKGDVYVENYGQAVLDEAFNLLYGGVSNTYIHTTTNDKGINVVLTDAQSEVVDRQLSKFILDYVEQAKSRIAQFKDFIPENLYNNTNIAEFALNHHLMYVGFGELFEGDTKFYKDSQTFLKRAKEGQASGIPYGVVDYSMDLTSPRILVRSSLNVGEGENMKPKTFTRTLADGTTEEIEIGQYNKFRGVTIKNTVKTGPTIGTFKTDKDGEFIRDENGNVQFEKKGSLSVALIKALRASGMTAKNAEIHAANMMSGYVDTTVNDAQSYITFEEWVRRITARGQYPKYKELIESVLDETKPLDSKTIGAFIQVQKNFYYDQHYNKDLNIIHPRQIKNAEFVLVPRLIAGTQLEQVYKLMKDNGIDQLNTEETSKAGKCNVLELWDNNGDLTQNNIDAFNAKAKYATELYNYNYLYTQQETPQHVNAENKAGIQIMKKIIDNIPKDDERYKDLYKLKEKFFKLYSANVKHSFTDLMTEFNIETDENGNLKLETNPDGTKTIKGLNAEVFYQRLQEEVARLGLDSNMLDYVTLGKDGNPIMPAHMSNVINKFESICQSIFNSRITRQKLPGFHAAQITNVGWRTFGESVQQRSYSKDLRYHPDGKSYVEIMLPKSNFNLKYTNEDGSLKTDEQLLKELEDAGLDMMIGYRIPTEGKQSVCVMKVVGFTDDALGSTIVVPDDWVAQTGSDFDIDSVYGINFKGRVNKEGKAEKIPYSEDEYNRDGNNNEILQTMIDILSDPLSLEENLSRSNFDKITEAKKKNTTEHENIIRSNRSPYNFFDQADYQEDVMSGAKLKAFSVTRDNFLSVCNTVRPTISDKYKIRVRYNAEFTKDDTSETKKKKVKDLAKRLKQSFDDVEVVDDGVTVTHNTFGWTKDNKNVTGSLLTAYSSQTTAHILDAVKEGMIPNVNDFTFKVYKTFPDVGIDYDTAVAFMMQPGVNAIVKAYNRNKSIYSNTTSNPINDAIREIAIKLKKVDNLKINDNMSNKEIIKKLQQYNNEVALLFDSTDKDFKISTDIKEITKLSIPNNILQQRIKASSPVESKEDLLIDLGVILHYKKLAEFSDKISNYARVCNPDKFGAKQTIFATNKIFNDIANIIQEDIENPVLKANKNEVNINILECVYPGIKMGLDSFIEQNDTEIESSYPPLYNFLKYATGTSIKVNRSLFLTQDEAFVDQLMQLQTLFSGNNKIDEKTYKDFQSYVLNYLYSQTDVVSQPCTYVEGQGIVFRPGGNIAAERARIYGYSKTPDLVVPNGKGKTELFTVKDIAHPTQREINQFATLSPTQKVIWIQQHFRESGIFKYIKATPFNPKNTGKAGMQTIQYVEGNESIETIYDEFEKCYFNKNPFVKLATIDLIKYSFAVEGFKMRRNAVNKVIKNNVLYLDAEHGGTGLVSQMNEAIKTISTNSLEMTNLRNKYIRSHSTTNKIENRYVKKVSKKHGEKEVKVFELSRLKDGIIVIDKLSTANKYGLLKSYDENNNDLYETNSYVRLSFGKDSALYKINDLGYGEIVLHPINTLEENEFSDWSVNSINNKFPNLDYYRNIVQDYYESRETNIGTTINEIIETNKENRTFNPNARLIRPVGNNFARSFNINQKNSIHTYGFEKVIDKVEQYTADNPYQEVYVLSRDLSEFIKHTGKNNGSIQRINGRLYSIERVNFSSENRKYIEDNQTVKEDNPSKQEIMTNAQQGGYKANDVFKITPYSDVRYSSVTEESPVTENISSKNNSSVVALGIRSMRTMAYRRASEGDRNASESLKYLNDRDIVVSDVSVQENLLDVIRTTHDFVRKSVEDIMNNIKYFKTENGINYSIISPEVMDLIRTDENERNRFLKTILDADAFVKQYSLINELDISSQDEDLKYYLEQIKKDINDLGNATIINDAYKLYGNNYLAKLSNDPNIQQNYLSILDGYHGTSFFDAWINDLQETSNPVLQIVTKEVMGNIRAEEMKAQKTVTEFKTAIANIKKKAKEAGVSIDMSHIIDDYGKFVESYNKAFVDRIQELRQNRDNAKAIYGEGSEEALRAKLEYDKWKLKYTNQLLNDDYYRRSIELTERMLGDGKENEGFKTIFVEYNKLVAKRRELQSHARSGVLEDNYQKELKKVKQDIDNLVEPYYYDQASNSYQPKYSYESPNNPFTGKNRELFSLEGSIALRNYLKGMKALREEYFDENAKIGFDEQLERNLDIIKNYEIRVGGEITTPTAELMKHEDYVKAKNWLDTNARFVVNEGLKDEINLAFKNLSEKSSGRAILKATAKRLDAYDSHGTIDATKFSEKDIADIKKEQLEQYNINEASAFKDTSLISNAPSDPTIFTSEFYRQMTSNGAKNQDYIAKVNEINTILSKYYNTFERTLSTSNMSEEDINTLIKLYKELDDIKKTTGSTNGKQVATFIKNQVEFVYDTKKYEQERNFAQQNDKGNAYFELWKRLNETVDEDGNVTPNKYLYGYAKPKGYVEGDMEHKYVDRKKTLALKTLREKTRTTPTTYYYQKYKEMRAKSDVEFNAWYEANHIYNPHRHVIEPLQCWTKLEVNPDYEYNNWEGAGVYVPSFKQTDIVPKEEKLNKNYKVGQSTADNYKGGFDEYNNSIKTNEYEEEIKQVYKDMLNGLAKTTQAKRFINQGYMVTRARERDHDAKFIAKETAKLLGWINNASGKETFYSDDRVDYAYNTTPEMPMTSLLRSKETLPVPNAQPKREENESEEDYIKRLDEYNKKKKEIEDKNAAIHKDLLDNNWESVMEDFIIKAAHYNAVQENKYMLFYAKHMIDNLDIYVKNLGFNDLQTTGERTADDKNIYATKKDTNLQKQYVNWVRRLVLDQWKESNNRFTRAGDILQSLTSAKFMMLNITGGIANITAGHVQIIGELLSKEYFGGKTWAKGMDTWRSGIPSFIADMYKEEASTLSSGIVKFFNVVDFDEQTGSVHIPNASEYIKRVRDIAFSPQAMGEHMMQNGALFAMLHSHRLVENKNKSKNGRLSYEYMNESEYTNKIHQESLISLLNEEEKKKFKDFIKDELKDANDAKEYAWFRSDFATKFANMYFDNDRKKEWIKKRDEDKKEKLKEFNDDSAHPTLYSQLELGSDGKLTFKEGSILFSMGDEAYKLLGRFKGRVISVNKKIHGVYDRLGAAKIESHWWGGFVMQYHKHIHPGIMKRWRRQGYFNEERGTIEKGCYASLKDFLAIPLHSAKYKAKLKAETGINDAELTTMEGIQNIAKAYVDFALNIKLNYKTMTEYDRANIRRALGDFIGVIAAVCGAIVLHMAGDDDDDKNGFVYNLMMYETDRLASESFMYNPIGLASEGKKLWSSPIAVSNSIEDGLTALSLVSQYLIQGDDFDPNYQSGMYAGENKFGIMLKRNIPMYHSIFMLERLERSNKYYKLGENMLSIIPTKDIADYISK